MPSDIVVEALKAIGATLDTSGTVCLPCSSTVVVNCFGVDLAKVVRLPREFG